MSSFFDVHRTCGRCRACTVHRTPTRCTARRVYGITDSAAEGFFGGWSEFVYLEPGVGIARLPDAISFESYIGGGCGLLTAVHILERAALRPGDTVLVQGTGAVGLSAIALARLGGASTIFAIGAPAERLALARRMGADVTFDLDSTTAGSARTACRPGRTTKAWTSSSRRPDRRARSRRASLSCGTAAATSLPATTPTSVRARSTRIGTSIGSTWRSGGCWGSEVGHFLRALSPARASRRTVPWHEIGGRRYGLQSLNEALEDAAAMRITKALVDPWGRGTKLC